MSASRARKTPPAPAAEIEALRARLAALEAHTATLERAAAAAERRVAEARSVLEVSRAIPASLDLQTVLELIVEHACTLLHTRKSALAVLESEGDASVIRFVARRGLSPQFPERMRPRHWRDGTTPTAIAERRPAWSADILHDPAFGLTPETRAAVLAEQYRAVLSVPLLAGDRVLGALAVYRETVAPFSPDEVELLQAFGAQAAVAVDNARAYHAAERRRREAEVLASLARDINAAHELPAIFQRVANGARELCQGEVARIALREAASGAVTTRCWSGSAGRGAGVAAVEPGRVLGDRVLETGRPARTAPREAGDGAAGDFASMAVPIRIENRVEGLLAVERRRPPFSDEDEAILGQLADHAAIAIQNARLLTESEAGRRAAESLADLGRLVSQSLDLAEVGSRMVESVRTLVGAAAATLYRLEEGTGDLAALASSGALGPTLGPNMVVPRGVSVSGRAVDERRPVSSANVLTDPRIVLTPEFRARLDTSPLRAALAVPLVVQDRVIGCLSVADGAGREFAAEEIRLVQAFADRAALALDHARLYDEVQQRLAETTRRQREAEELARMARTLTESLDTAQVGERIVASVRPLFGARSAGLRLLEPDGSLRTVVWGDVARAHAGPGHVMPASLGISGRVISEGRAVWSSDVVEDPRIVLTDDMREWMVSSDDRALLCVPLRVKGAIIGVLSVADRRGREYSEAEAALLQTCADQAAIALENSRLYGELQGALQAVEASQQRVIQGERLRALGELAGGVAHDFNNILAVVLGRAQLLLRQAPDPAVRRQIEVIEQMALDGARTVRRIQEFARMRRARPFQPVDLNQVIAEVIEVTQARRQDPAQASDGAAHEVRVDAAPLPPIAGDPSELREALTNLVLNALDAMPRGGRLTFETRTDGNLVWCVVSDTGTGMPEEVRRRVFDPFFTTKGERGTGLGLSLVYGIVRRHGGDIEVRSEVGRGSSFRLRFPAARETPDAAPEPGVARSHQAARVLVIDDEGAVRDVLRDALTAAGHTVVTEADGAAGLARLEHEPFDLVFTDLGMPDLSGWEVARQARLRRPDTPIALVTGWGDQIDPAEARARGVDYLVPKPCQVEDVMTVVGRALARPDSREGRA